jgi:predicted O-methyltransferase YrrM
MSEYFPETRVKRIGELLAADTEPAGLDLYPHIFAEHALMPLQRQNELRAMMALARTFSPQVVMEVGTDRGGGLYHWCKGFSPRRAIACEVEGTPYAADFELAFPQTEFLWLPVSSYAVETVTHVRGWLGADKLDVLFLDGDKAKFTADFMAYVPMVRPGGLVLMHDVTDPSPGRSFEECRADPRVKSSRVIHDTREADAAVERRRTGLPPASPYENWLRIWEGRSCGVGVMELR